MVSMLHCHLVYYMSRERQVSMSATDSVSEVARLRERLEKEYEALTLLKAGFAVSANHTSITKRMELFGDCLSQTQEQLTLLIGDAAAEQVVAEVLLG